MSVTAPCEPYGNGYRHEALFYAGTEELVRATLPFLRDAVAAGEPTLVVLTGDKIDALTCELKSDAERICFSDMGEVGRNPARVIPLWNDFLNDRSSRGRRVRGIGEPIWAGLDATALEECERHEALLNIAFADPQFWLLCPYDTASLEAAVIDTARRNHPFLCEMGVSRTSGSFPGSDEIALRLDAPLPEPPAGAAALDFDKENLSDLRSLVASRAYQAGFSQERTAELVLAVNEIATNSLIHGGGRGGLLAWSVPGGFVCDIRDKGDIADPLAGRRRPSPLREGGRGLWLANQLCELVQIRSTPTGTAIRLHVRRS